MERSILEWSVRALLMAMGVGVLLPALRIRSAVLRHTAWTAVLIAMLLLPVWTQWGPSVTARILPAQEERAMPVSFEALPAAPVESAAPSFVPAAVQRAPVGMPIDWTRIFIALYFAGAALMLVRLLAGTLQIRRMLRRSREADGFRITSQCGAPVTAGWLHPVLLLPEEWISWSASKLDAVLIHEREHIRRRDPLVQWLALLNRCIFWFHPVAWWLEHRLAALSEEACDAAVLGSGHTAQDYSKYLIEIARSMNGRGSRLRWAGSVAFSSGKLARRVRWMMEAEPAVRTSGTMRAAVTVSCALLLGTCLACNIGRSSRPASGQPSMAELAALDSARGREQSELRNRRNEELAVAALHLTDAAAIRLDTLVRSRPDDLDNAWVLLRHYERAKNTKALEDLTLWYIAEHPEVRRDWGTSPYWDHVWDEDTYTRGRELWSRQLKKSWDSPYFYMNAAEFLSGHDNELAEQILLDGQRRFPPRGLYSGLHWEVFLARHYAWAIEGGSGQLPASRIVFARPTQAPETPYAQKVRAALESSNDAELLSRLVEQLQVSPPNQQFAVALSDRVLRLDPSNPSHHRQNIGLREQQHLMEIRREPGVRTDSERLALLLADSRWFGPSVREADAWMLLGLAAANRKDANYGTAVFTANMVLGYAAAERGNQWEAVRRLRAAADAPVTDKLRYSQLDMSLPSRLVDAGERDAVADFLERCAKFSGYGREYADWAKQIRRGVNPRMGPTAAVVRRAAGLQNRLGG